jgi:hypothetical protein
MLPRRCTRRGAAGFAPLSGVAREGGSQLSVDTLAGRIKGDAAIRFHEPRVPARSARVSARQFGSSAELNRTACPYAESARFRTQDAPRPTRQERDIPVLLVSYFGGRRVRVATSSRFSRMHLRNRRSNERPGCGAKTSHSGASAMR